MINAKEYKERCECFFEEGVFHSEEALVKEIGSMSPIDFKDWQTKIFIKYARLNDTQKIIKDMREEDGFDTNATNVDWEKDPIKKPQNKVIVELYRNIYGTAMKEGLNNFKIYKEKAAELKEHFDKEQQNESLKINVNGKDFVAEKIIDVLWSGWESDGKAWLVNDNGVKRLVMSNHGTLAFTDKSVLEEKIQEYEKAMKDSKEILKSLEGTRPKP